MLQMQDHNGGSQSCIVVAEPGANAGSQMNGKIVRVMMFQSLLIEMGITG